MRTASLAGAVAVAVSAAAPSAAGAAGELSSLGKPVDAEGQSISVAVSPDGRSVYVGGAGGGGAITVLSRNKRSGALKRLRGRQGCLTRTGSRRRCTRDRSMKDVFEIAISPDGRTIYAGGTTHLRPYARNARTGALRRIGSPVKASGDPVLSRDGRYLYAGSVAFARNPSTGALTPGPPTTLGVPLPNPRSEQITLTPDGRFAYLLASSRASDNAFVVAMSRDPSTGALAALPDGCFQAKPEIASCGLTGWAAGIEPKNLPAVFYDGAGIEVMSGGKTVVTAINSGDEGAEHSIGELGTFTRDSATGALTPFPGKLQSGGLTDNFNGFAVSPDGKNVYQASDMLPAIQTLAIRSDGMRLGVQCLVQDTQRGCKKLPQMDFPAGVGVSPDGRNVYIANAKNLLAFKRR